MLMELRVEDWGFYALGVATEGCGLFYFTWKVRMRGSTRCYEGCIVVMVRKGKVAT
jgi:hypothetical protein